MKIFDNRCATMTITFESERYNSIDRALPADDEILAGYNDGEGRSARHTHPRKRTPDAGELYHF
jgi:hypothetical protein